MGHWTTEGLRKAKDDPWLWLWGLVFAGGLLCLDKMPSLATWAHSILIVAAVGSGSIVVSHLRQCLSTGPAITLLPLPLTPAEINEKWRQSVNDFCRDATPFWEGVRQHFTVYGHLGQSCRPAVLDKRVRTALWPMDADDGSFLEEDGAHISATGSAFLLKDFTRRLYDHDTTAFDPYRKAMSRLVRDWWSWANYASAEDEQAFATWLARELGTSNVATTKLLWYVNEAYAQHLQSPGDYNHFTWLRGVLGPLEQQISAANH